MGLDDCYVHVQSTCTVLALQCMYLVQPYGYKYSILQNKDNLGCVYLINHSLGTEGQLVKFAEL